MTLKNFKALLLHNGLATREQVRHLDIYDVYNIINEALGKLCQLEMAIKQLSNRYNETLKYDS